MDVTGASASTACPVGWTTAGVGSTSFSDCHPADNDNDGSPNDLDCDDDNDTVYPGAPLLVDGLDNDCDGSLDNRGDVLIVAGVPGKGLKNAPGLSKQQNGHGQ